jgi:hypothetical protein
MKLLLDGLEVAGWGRGGKKGGGLEPVKGFTGSWCDF